MTAVARTRADLASARGQWAASGDSVAVVMTMGALHAGHAELIRRAREHDDRVIVTDFLNPLQFAPGEDLDKYPRTFTADLELCRTEGVDLLFAPGPSEVYPVGDPVVRVAAGPIGDVLEGESRPGHFDGVLTVVGKLLNLTTPHRAYFGQKDAQQLWLISQMVRDLDVGVEIVEVPTVRDPDGLALSSRNIYLVDADRMQALALHAALELGVSAASGGSTAAVESTRAHLAESGVKVDYVSLVDPQSFDLMQGSGPAILVVAAHVGSTRLIDNVRLHVSAGKRG
ncbi:MAG: pantoate--beta-alanine ligase [Actinomycetia bacterium]|nr:pantoate--beta-alanine ligase [Actinomycetes bacterium]